MQINITGRIDRKEKNIFLVLFFSFCHKKGWSLEKGFFLLLFFSDLDHMRILVLQT